jgi:hypothetical protein
MGVETQKAILLEAIREHGRAKAAGVGGADAGLRAIIAIDALISEAQTEATAELSLKLARCEAMLKDCVALLRSAEDMIHIEYCSEICHPTCAAIESAIARAEAQEGGDESEK